VANDNGFSTVDIDDDDAGPITRDKLELALSVIRNVQSADPDFRLGLRRADLRGLDLHGMDLSLTDLREADLSHTNLSNANLKEVDLIQTSLVEANLEAANLQGAYLFRANLFGAQLRQANLQGANLSAARITGAGLFHANLSDCDLRETQFQVVNMRGSVLAGANLLFTVFHGVDFHDADFSNARLSSTIFVSCDLSGAVGLKRVIHDGPSHIDGDTFRESRGSLPSEFLSGCGLEQWQIIESRLYAPQLTADDIRQICNELFAERASGNLMRRTFISYSHADAKFVDKLQKRLKREGVSVWLDKHELFAGGLQKQIHRAISEQDVVILVLSEHSPSKRLGRERARTGKGEGKKGRSRCHLSDRN
jgi:uncharacterized protein YjbI with pentapeptide repeats